MRHEAGKFQKAAPLQCPIHLEGRASRFDGREMVLILKCWGFPSNSHSESMMGWFLFTFKIFQVLRCTKYGYRLIDFWMFQFQSLKKNIRSSWWFGWFGKSSEREFPITMPCIWNKMQPTNPNAHTYVNGTDVKTHGYAVTHNTFLQ